MDSLPEDLFIDIVRRVGKRSFRDLGPFIAASKTTKEVGFKEEGLAKADMSDFVLNSSMANRDSIYRSFFIACVSNGNIPANQLEGLRILSQEGPSDEAFAMLDVRRGDPVYSSFVTGIFRICAGDYDRGMETFSHLWEIVDAWEESVFIGKIVVSQIITMGTPRSGLYFASHTYPFEDVPACVFVGCAADEVC